ncbi:DUF7373 family lipoprotein [Mycolicibacterium sp. Dal123E01]|uniref:DUF7373 family lipoprotein n=1 Tax=Mycolicibacterium sp. Dal123E01 TaxID=3457578 RepID=UPI00403E8964
MPGKTGTAARIALAAAVLAALSGCTDVHRGAAIKEPHDDPNEVNVALLDHGSYPDQPQPPLGTVKSGTGGSEVEAKRMATNIALPTQVSPELTDPFPQFTGVITRGPGLRALVSDEVASAAEANHYITGFNTERSGVVGSAPARLLSSAVLRFATPEDAAAAATAMSAAPDSTLLRESAPATIVPIPGHPATLAWLYQIDGGFNISAYTAHGPYVFYQYAGSKATVDAAAALVGATIDVQGPMIDAFAATPVDKLTSLPIDPTGLLARAVPVKQASVNAITVYAPHAALHFEPNLDAAQKMYTELGIDAVAVYRTWVYQTKDVGSASAGLDQLLAATVASPKSYAPAPGVPGLPQARCYARNGGDPDTRYLCMATADRYLFKVTAAQDVDARQVISAQYLMLTAPK